jgi:hypothetical protein
MLECIHCGSQSEEGALECFHCGQSLSAPGAAEPAAFAPEPLTTLGNFQPFPETPLFSAAEDSVDRGLTGIGGWLILQAIGLAVAPFVILGGIFIDCKALFGSLAALAGRPGLEVLILFEAITNLLFFAALICLNVLFYKKKKAFPACMITFFVAQFVFLLADHLMAARFPPSPVPVAVIRSFVVCAIWIPYYLNSRRVGLTFVN